MTSIGENAFQGCRLSAVVIPNSLTSIGRGVFSSNDFFYVISLIENPFAIEGKASNNRTFSRYTFDKARLYVPKGTIEKYKETDGWKDFVSIVENDIYPTPETCEKPTISYQNGKLTFTCATEGATCHYSITDTDIKAGSGNEVQLTATYNISVYAAKEGFENSETATATLCWIDAIPQTEDITTRLEQIAARPVLVKTDRGFITVEGVDEGTPVSVYALDGKLAGSAVSRNGAALVGTNVKSGNTAIVKIGNKSVKVMMK